MKRAFQLTSDRHLSSALVPEFTKDALRVGDRITVSRLLDIAEDIQITAGERGRVAYIDASTGAAEVLMATRHKGLDGWDNHILIEPFDTDDILDGLVCARASGVLAHARAIALAATCSIWVAFGCGAALYLHFA